jgi:hypothetical protein
MILCDNRLEDISERLAERVKVPVSSSRLSSPAIPSRIPTWSGIPLPKKSRCSRTSPEPQLYLPQRHTRKTSVKLEQQAEYHKSDQ